jgi:hypothetical protein
MTLALVFRVMGVFMGLWGVGMWLAPETLAENWDWELTNDMSTMMQFMGTMMIAFSVVHWQMPTWVEDNLKTVGIAFAIIHTAFFILNVYQMAVGNIPSTAMNIGGNVPQVALIVLMYLKSR